MDQEIIDSIRQVASQLVTTLKTVYVTPRVLEPLEAPQAHEHVRLGLYQKQMQEAGFEFLGDYADRTLEKLGSAHEIRYRLAKHQNGAYLLQYLFDNQRIIEIGHHFQSGGGMVTSNAWASRHLENVDDWAAHYVTPDKTWEEIWQWHLQRLEAAHLQGLGILGFETLEEFLKLSLDKLEREQAYRQNIPGFVRENELRAYLEQPFEIREQFYKELVRNSF